MHNKSYRLDNLIRRQKRRLFTDSAFMTAMTAIGVIVISVLM